MKLRLKNSFLKMNGKEHYVMMRAVATGLLLLGVAAQAGAQVPAPALSPLHREYREGETLTYRMNGLNESWHYTIQADGIVKKDTAGAFFEEYRWSGMETAGQPITLSATTPAFRQRVSLDPNQMPGMPDLSKLDPRMIGPVTDFMTFHTDLWLILKTGQLHKPGDHFYFPMPITPSWADGTHVLVGEDSIAFDMTWKSVNAADQIAVLLIRHVPPEKPAVHLKADWMQAHVADTPNNWVQIRKTNDGKYEASVGKETFDVELRVSLKDGRILHGSMENPVKTVDRTCEDEALTKCDTAKPHEIMRKIEITLQK